MMRIVTKGQVVRWMSVNIWRLLTFWWPRPRNGNAIVHHHHIHIVECSQHWQVVAWLQLEDKR